MNTVGNFTVTATAKDVNNNTGTTTASLAVNNLAGTPPTISLTAPTADQYGNIQITSPTAITGPVSDDHTNGVSYTVTVIPADGSPSFQIGSGSTTTASTLNLSYVTFDPTMLADGDIFKAAVMGRHLPSRHFSGHRFRFVLVLRHGILLGEAAGRPFRGQSNLHRAQGVGSPCISGCPAIRVVSVVRKGSVLLRPNWYNALLPMEGSYRTGRFD